MIRDYKELVSFGLGNEQAPGFHELADRPKAQLTAYCTSNTCCAYTTRVKNAKGQYRTKTLHRAKFALKDLPQSAGSCPHCNHTVLWLAHDGRIKA